MRGIMVGPSGVVKDVKVGFSWTALFFGMLCPLFRGDFKWFVIFLLVDWMFIPWLVLPFIYNRIYIKGLFEKGYQPGSDDLARALRRAGITV